MIQGFKGHACGDSPITNDGHSASITASMFGGNGHAQCGADGGTGMTHTKRVIGAFSSRRKRRQTILVLDGVQLIASTGEYLVWIGLMAHIPYQSIFRGIEYIVQGDG